MFETLTVERAVISNPNSYDSIDNPVIVTVLYKEGMRTDFNDVRFYSESGDSLLFSLSSKVNGDNAVFIVKMDYVPAEGDIYLVMGYGDNLTPSLAVTANELSKVYGLANSSKWTLNPSTFLVGQFTGGNAQFINDGIGTAVSCVCGSKGHSGKIKLNQDIDYYFSMIGTLISRDTDFSIIFFYLDDNNYYEIYHNNIFNTYLRKHENGAVLTLASIGDNIWGIGKCMSRELSNFELTVTENRIYFKIDNTVKFDYTGSIDIMGGGFGITGYSSPSAYDAGYCLGMLGGFTRATELLGENLVASSFEEWSSKSLEVDTRLNYLSPYILDNKTIFCIRPLREDVSLIFGIRGFGSTDIGLIYVSQSVFKRDYLDNFKLVYTVPSLSSSSDSRIIFIVSGTFTKAISVKGLISYDVLGLPNEDENITGEEGEEIEENIDEEGSFIVIIGDTTYV